MEGVVGVLISAVQTWLDAALDQGSLSGHPNHHGYKGYFQLQFVVPCFANSTTEPPPPQHPHLCPLDLGYLFLVTSLRIPGGVASRTWMGLVSLAGSSPPFPAQDRSWRVRNCRSPLPSPSPPLPAATESLTFFTPLPRNPKLMGPRMGVSLSLKGQNYSWGTGETSVPGYS